MSIHVPIPEALLTGSDLVAGRYRLEKVLGMGGMGYVVSAIQVGPDPLGQRVAIKFMLPEAMRSASLHRRFLREVEAIGRLRSEHVCRLLDAGRLPDGAPFMVMEYLSGADLERVIDGNGPLPLSQAADYGLQIIDAMAEAHSRGIVHRDLKPANVFRAWVRDGSSIIKVLDFGVAKAADGRHSTATNTVMGSPSFMAPEQLVSSKRVDERADVYSIGAVLFYLLTGKPPYDAEQLPALCLKVLNEDPPPPSLHRPDLPDQVDEIVLTCMDREPGNRYPNVAELAHALMPLAPERCRALAVGAAAALGVIPGSWSSPRAASFRAADTVSVRRPEPPADGYATQLVGGSSGGISAERKRSARRRLWTIGAAAAACLGLGVAASMALIESDLVPTRSAGAEVAPEASPPATPPPASRPETTASTAPSAIASPAIASPAESPASQRPVADDQALPADADTGADRAVAVEDDRARRSRRQRARARARVRQPERSEELMVPAPPEASAAPAEAVEERRPREEQPPAPCSVDDPLCAFGTAR